MNDAITQATDSMTDTESTDETCRNGTVNCDGPEGDELCCFECFLEADGEQ